MKRQFKKSSNTLKQFVCKLPTNCLSVFDHFVRLALKGLRHQRKIITKPQHFADGETWKRRVKEKKYCDGNFPSILTKILNWKPFPTLLTIGIVFFWNLSRFHKQGHYIFSLQTISGTTTLFSLISPFSREISLLISAFY